MPLNVDILNLNFLIELSSVKRHRKNFTVILYFRKQVVLYIADQNNGLWYLLKDCNIDK